jgi:hypothetical protein
MVPRIEEGRRHDAGHRHPRRSCPTGTPCGASEVQDQHRAPSLAVPRIERRRWSSGVGHSDRWHLEVFESRRVGGGGPRSRPRPARKALRV